MNSFAAAGSVTAGGLPTTGLRWRRATGAESSASAGYMRVNTPVSGSASRRVRQNGERRQLTNSRTPAHRAGAASARR